MLSDKISIRNTLAQIYHSYYSDTDISQLSQFTQSKISFFTDFQRRNKMISCRIQNIATVPKQSFHRAYTLYQIDVLTEQLYFTTQKRYSEFEKLNKRIKKFKSLQLTFPKKTYFQSGTQISVTSQRISLLNQYIDSILKLGDQFSDIKFMFFDFIGLWDKYVQKGVDINNADYQYFLANSQNIYIQILKLNQNPKIVSSILQRIKKLIFDYKIKLSLETARQLFFGLENDKKGLLAFAFNIDNQYVAIQCLQLINDLIDPQLSKNSQLFLKTLQSSSSKRLVVEQIQLFQNINFKKLYFQLLKQYQSKPLQKDLKSIFVNSKEVYHEYIFWLKGKKAKQINQDLNQLISASTYPTDLFDKIQAKKSFQKLKNKIQMAYGAESQHLILNQMKQGQSNLSKQLFQNKQNESQMKQEVNDQMKSTYLTQKRDCILFEGDNHIAFKILFSKDLKQKIQKIDRTKWQTFQQQIRSKYTDVITKTLNFKQQRRFKFNENYQKQNDKITLQPIHTDHFDDCFFQFSQIIQKDQFIEVIQIIYFCHNNSQQIKQYMKQKLQSYWIEKVTIIK